MGPFAITPELPTNAGLSLGTWIAKRLPSKKGKGMKRVVVIGCLATSSVALALLLGAELPATETASIALAGWGPLAGFAGYSEPLSLVLTGLVFLLLASSAKLRRDLPIVTDAGASATRPNRKPPSPRIAAA